MDAHDISFFDPQTEWSIVERGLPHWSQSGCVIFVTWRLCDSLPGKVIRELDEEIVQVLSREGIDPKANWKQQLAVGNLKSMSDVYWKLFTTRDKFLDQAFGACHLAMPECASIVLNSLRHFDDQRYFLTDAVIMPNHVHFLCAFADEAGFLKQCTEWKRYTARQINGYLGRSGKFWQVDQFDHLVRNPEYFEQYRKYIADNPERAKLGAGSYLHFLKEFS